MYILVAYLRSIVKGNRWNFIELLYLVFEFMSHHLSLYILIFFAALRHYLIKIPITQFNHFFYSTEFCNCPQFVLFWLACFLDSIVDVCTDTWIIHFINIEGTYRWCFEIYFCPTLLWHILYFWWSTNIFGDYAIPIVTLILMCVKTVH